MAPRLTLTLPPAFGNRTVAVDLKRFSIGRTSDNDLEIDDESLSRRHALIEDFEGRFTLSDCGSSNGTFVNGREVSSPVELSDWDILTFGGVDDILVRIEGGSNSAVLTPEGNRLPPYQQPTVGRTHVKQPIIAIVAAALILTIGAILVLVYQDRKTSSIKTAARSVNTQERNTLDTGNSQPSSTLETGASPTPDGAEASESDASGVVERYAAQVLRNISRDTRSALTEKPLTDITSQVERYRNSSSLENNLRNMKRSLPQVAAVAKANGVRTPMAVYATLARIDKNGGHGDPAQVAAAVCPMLARTLDAFGDELANDSLLAVAALEEGTGLQGRIAKLGSTSDSATTIRTIWYLHDHQVISNETYDFILRFIAIGVIAQDPAKFGIHVEPIGF